MVVHFQTGREAEGRPALLPAFSLRGGMAPRCQRQGDGGKDGASSSSHRGSGGQFVISPLRSASGWLQAGQRKAPALVHCRGISTDMCDRRRSGNEARSPWLPFKIALWRERRARGEGSTVAIHLQTENGQGEFSSTLANHRPGP